MNPSANAAAHEPEHPGAAQLPQPLPAQPLDLPPAILPVGSNSGAATLPVPPAFPATGRPDSLPTANLPVPGGALLQTTASDVSTTSVGAAPSTAEDTDLIEKEWVQKAKQIISSTQNDPFQQSKQINVFKADYMKKRYNKTIKLGE